MIKNLTCIECPKGCALSVDVEDSKVTGVEGNECPKGIKYAVAEIEHPARILTSTVAAEGLSLKMVPVRTDRPIPKADIKRAMDEIKGSRIKKPVVSGEVIAENFLKTGASLIATRGCGFAENKVR
jgi:CxxC motif-containing protein